MSIHPGLVVHLAMHAEAPPDEEAMLPARSGVQAWLQELAENELAMDHINPCELTQRTMQDVFGRCSLPPWVSGILAAGHLLRDADPQDRQGIRRLATAWFTPMPPSAIDESAWFVRQAVRRPQIPHLMLVGHAGDATEPSRCNARDGRILLVPESDDATMWRWDPRTGEGTDEPVDSPPPSIPARREATFINAYSRMLPAVPNGNNVKITDRATGEEVGVSPRGHSSRVTVVFSFYGPAGRPLLASASRDHTIRVQDSVFKSRPATRLVEQLDEVQAVAWFVVAGGPPRVGTIRNTYDDILQTWETGIGQWVGELNAHPGQLWAGARSVRFTVRQCGRMLVIAEQGSLRIRDLDLGQLVGEPPVGHAACINDILGWTTPFGEIRLATASSGGNIRFWDPAKGTQVGRSFTGHVGLVRVLCTFNTRHGDAQSALVGDGGVIRIWDPDVGRPIGRPLKGLSCPMTCVVAFPVVNGEPRLVTVGDDCIVCVWDPGNGR